MQNIFEIENRLDIRKEFSKLVKVFNSLKTVRDNYTYEWYTLFGFFDVKIFKKWKYRDTMLTTREFLEHIGISEAVLEGRSEVTKEKLLRYMEFVLNMLNKSEYQLTSYSREEILDATIENLGIILEKLNYKPEEVEDRIILTKRNSDVDSVLEYVPRDIVECLLKYNDFRIQNNIEEKKKILKDIDLYIEKNINLKSFDANLENAIGTVVNKMGVNHPITEEPYKSFTEEQLIEWYDKCFLMMIHAIRTVEVNKIKNERKQLLQK